MTTIQLEEECCSDTKLLIDAPGACFPTEKMTCKTSQIVGTFGICHLGREECFPTLAPLRTCENTVALASFNGLELVVQTIQKFSVAPLRMGLWDLRDECQSTSARLDVWFVAAPRFRDSQMRPSR